MFLGIVVAPAILIPLYFLPAIIRSKRKLPQKRTIGWLNLLLGRIVLVIFASLANARDLVRQAHGTRAPS